MKSTLYWELQCSHILRGQEMRVYKAIEIPHCIYPDLFKLTLHNGNSFNSKARSMLWGQLLNQGKNLRVE